MRLNTLKPNQGSTSSSKRPGRGIGSTIGKTGGRGHKGQKSRAGGYHKVGFEGGQMPLQRRLPKRGFTNIFKKKIVVVNLNKLKEFPAGTSISPQTLIEKGIIQKIKDGVKILGQGTLSQSLNVSAHYFSQNARDKISKAGGTAQEIK